MTARETTLRCAATAALAGIALVQAIALPSLAPRAGLAAILATAAIALAVGLAAALAAAPAGVARQLWRAVAATAVLVLAGSAAPHAFPVLGRSAPMAQWATVSAAALAAVCLVLAVAASPSARTAGHDLALAVALVFAMAGALHAAGQHGHLQAASGHAGAHAALESTFRFRPGSGRAGGHYLVPAATRAHPTALGASLLVAATLAFTAAAVRTLRRRSGPAAPRRSPASASPS